jgi:hypothetical protein
MPSNASTYLFLFAKVTMKNKNYIVFEYIQDSNLEKYLNDKKSIL